MPTIITVQIAVDDVDPRPSPGEMLSWFAQVSTEVGRQLDDAKRRAPDPRNNKPIALLRAGVNVGDALVLVHPPARRRKANGNEAVDPNTGPLNPQV